MRSLFAARQVREIPAVAARVRLMSVSIPIAVLFVLLMQRLNESAAVPDWLLKSIGLVDAIIVVGRLNKTLIVHAAMENTACANSRRCCAEWVTLRSVTPTVHRGVRRPGCNALEDPAQNWTRRCAGPNHDLQRRQNRADFRHPDRVAIRCAARAAG